MRRLIWMTTVAALCVSAAVVLPGTLAQGSSTYTFDAIFSNAKGIVPGQIVKIAGAKVGQVTAVSLTPDFKARVTMSIDGRFRPFHADAGCIIEPESLISENFLDCDPGTDAQPPLRAIGGYPPTIPLLRNTEPISVTDIFNIWNVPTAQRFQLFLNEAGAGFAGQGQNLNDVIRQANPALQLARQAIALATKQSQELQQIITATDPIAAQLARNSKQVLKFIDSAGQVAQTTADHASSLSDAIRLFPGVLAATQPALQQLDNFERAATPVVQNFGQAAPEIGQAVNNLGPFSVAGVPALQALTPTFNGLTTTLTNGRTTIDQLAAATLAANLPAQQLARLAVSLRDTGVIDNFFTFSYGAAGLLSRFDTISHLGVIGVVPNPPCDVYAGSSAVPGCTAWFPNGSAQPATASAARAAAAGGGAATASTAQSTVPPDVNSAPLQALLQYLLK